MSASDPNDFQRIKILPCKPPRSIACRTRPQVFASSINSVKGTIGPPKADIHGEVSFWVATMFIADITSAVAV